MVPGCVVVEPLDPVVPVEPPLPTVPELLPPTPVLPEPVPAPEPAVLPEPMPVDEPPVLEAPMSCRHLSFIDCSVSCSHFARAEALSVVPELAPADDEAPEAPVPDEVDGLDDAPALEESLGELDELELDGEVVAPAEPVVLPPVADEPPVELVPEVWATATLVAARKAAATAACRIFIVIDCSSTVEWVMQHGREQAPCRRPYCFSPCGGFPCSSASSM